jgi:magnesium-transporting ATPase (P-type)
MYDRIKHEDYRIPFCTTSKYSIVVIKHPENPNRIRVFAKGAPEVVLPCCQFGLTEYGQKDEFKAEETLSLMKE